MKDLVNLRYSNDKEFKQIIDNAKSKNIELLHFERSGKSSYWGGCMKNGEWVGENVLGKLLMMCG
jgi:hypothetical protein